MRRLRSVFVLLALLALPAAAAPRTEEPMRQQAAAPGALDAEFMGMAIRDPFYEFGTNPAFPGAPNQTFQDTMGALLQTAGVRWVRLEFIADPDGHVNFAKYDYFIGTVAPRYGLKVLGLLSTNSIRNVVRVGDHDEYYPIYLNIAPANLTHPVYGSALNQYMIEWLDEAMRVAAHYDGHDPQAGRVHAFEIFNEVNRLFGDGTNLHAGLDYAGLNPSYVARIQAKFYRVCKNTDGLHAPARCPADTLIVSGGLHPKGTSNRRTSSQPETFYYTDEEYLRQMYISAFTDYRNAQGAWPVDGVAFHPYPEEIIPRAEIQGVYEDIYLKILPRITQIRTMLQTVGDGAKPIWITEIGYNLGYYKVIQAGGEVAQVRFMREVYTNLAARGDIANVFWFKYEDFPPATGPNAQMWGVVRIPFSPGCIDACYEPSGTPTLIRQSFWAYRELAGLPVFGAYSPLVAR